MNKETLVKLGHPFDSDTLEFLPKAPSNGRALALAYIDARAVMNRLDEVVGPENWSFAFEVLSPDCKKVKGRLTVLGVTKEDAGEASTEDEPLKSAVSDALKRAAVHFNVGRYLHYLPLTWAPFDAQKRRFTERPPIPREALALALRQCGVEISSAGEVTERRPTGRDLAREHVARGAEQSPSYGATAGLSAPDPESSGDRQATEKKAVLRDVQRMTNTATERNLPVRAELTSVLGFKPPELAVLSLDQLVACKVRLAEMLAESETAAA